MKFLLIASFADSLLGFRGALIEALLKHGLEVHVAAPGLNANSGVRRQLEAKGVIAHDMSLHRTGLNPFADLRTLLDLWRLVRAVHPEFVLGYTIKPVIYGSLAARLAKAPHRFALITGLGYAFSEPTASMRGRGALRSLTSKLYAVALRCTHKVFFQNPDDQALFRSLAILGPRTPSVVINGSGVDISAFQPAPLPNGPHFLLIARLLGDKGVREYAQAARQIREGHPETTFSLVGWLDDNPDSIAQHELNDWVGSGAITYLGRLNDVRPAIAACSVYVLPSYREGTPRTVLEAMAMGRAIITTDAPGCRETVTDGDNGFLVPVRSADHLAQAMLRFIDDPAMAQRMGERSRVVAETKYDVNKVNTTMLQEMHIA